MNRIARRFNPTPLLFDYRYEHLATVGPRCAASLRAKVSSLQCGSNCVSAVSYSKQPRSTLAVLSANWPTTSKRADVRFGTANASAA